jgi:hypothetical protein
VRPAGIIKITRLQEGGEHPRKFQTPCQKT